MFFENIIAGAFTLLVLFGLLVFMGYLFIEFPYVVIIGTALTIIAVAAIFKGD